MLRKDLLVRQFEEFGKVMAVILGFKKQNDLEKFEKEIADATKKFTPFELTAVEFISPDSFEKEILEYPGMKPEQFRMLADLLFEKIKYYLEQEKEEVVPGLKTKCILLYKKYTENFTHNEFNMDVHYKMDFLQRL
jgi:hypothetical protein